MINNFILLKETVNDKIYLDRIYELWNKFDKQKGLNPFSSLVLYTFIREYRPKSIIEMSPDKGWSTYIMLNAILDSNYADQLQYFHSFDLTDKIANPVKNLLKNKFCEKYKLFLGDARKTVKIPNELDFWFIDSDHSYSFADWYSKYLDIPKYFMIDDIDPSEEYFRKREDKSLFPGWTGLEDIHCGGEPLIIYQWLRNKGFYYDKTKIYYDINLSSSREEANQYYEAIWKHNNPELITKIFWCQLEQKNVIDKMFLKWSNCRQLFYCN